MVARVRLGRQIVGRLARHRPPSPGPPPPGGHNLLLLGRHQARGVVLREELGHLRSVHDVVPPQVVLTVHLKRPRIPYHLIREPLGVRLQESRQIAGHFIEAQLTHPLGPCLCDGACYFGVCSQILDRTWHVRHRVHRVVVGAWNKLALEEFAIWRPISHENDHRVAEEQVLQFVSVAVAAHIDQIPIPAELGERHGALLLLQTAHVPQPFLLTAQPARVRLEEDRIHQQLIWILPRHLCQYLPRPRLCVSCERGKVEFIFPTDLSASLQHVLALNVPPRGPELVFAIRRHEREVRPHEVVGCCTGGGGEDDRVRRVIVKAFQMLGVSRGQDNRIISLVDDDVQIRNLVFEVAQDREQSELRGCGVLACEP
mmetsp:Transcript_2564/g.4277  ORF Transcript_2564/g.4277 Transcript_2564/m.4277 type:complete len:371 (-) Transcript_2564:139-1251(-)